MKNFSIAWKIFELLMTIATHPNYKEAVDKMLDPVEDMFEGNKTVIRICNRIRKKLDVPDDD